MTGVGGIVNVGLTCYANAVIQAFRHCYNIKTLFQEGTYNKLLKVLVLVVKGKEVSTLLRLNEDSEANIPIPFCAFAIKVYVLLNVLPAK